MTIPPLAKKAGSPARMAGSPAFLIHQKQNGVIVAIQTHGLHFLNMTGGFAFMPQLFAAPAPVMGLAAGQGGPPGFLIHPGKHQHFPCSRILGHSR